MLLAVEILTISMLILFIAFYVVGKTTENEGLRKAGKVFLVIFLFCIFSAFIIGTVIGSWSAAGLTKHFSSSNKYSERVNAAKNAYYACLQKNNLTEKDELAILFNCYGEKRNYDAAKAGCKKNKFGTYECD